MLIRRENIIEENTRRLEKKQAKDQARELQSARRPRTRTTAPTRTGTTPRRVLATTPRCSSPCVVACSLLLRRLPRRRGSSGWWAPGSSCALWAVRTLAVVGGVSSAAGDGVHRARGDQPRGRLRAGLGVAAAPFYFYVSYGMIRYLFHDDESPPTRYATGGRSRWSPGASPTCTSRPRSLAGLVHRRRRRGERPGSSAVPVVHDPDQVGLSDIPRGARAVARDGRAGGRRALRRAGGRPAGRAHGRSQRPEALAAPQASQPSGRCFFGSFETTRRYDSSTASSSSSSGISPESARLFHPDRPM